MEDTIITTPDNDISTLGLLYLASPTLPIGSFSYSQGLASAIELGWVTDGSQLETWISGVLEYSMVHVDLPLLFRLHRAAAQDNQLEFKQWNALTLACRETAELLDEELQLGRALLRLLRTQKLLPTMKLPQEPGFVAMFALASMALGVPAREACLAMAWSWAENQTAVACKAIPLGQTDAQGILLRIRPIVISTVTRALSIRDDELGFSLPGLALASSLHETQYSRMFRS
jgi:urease accessory protein